MPRFEGALPYVGHGSETRYIAASEKLLSFLAINVVYQFICIKYVKMGVHGGLSCTVAGQGYTLFYCRIHR